MRWAGWKGRVARLEARPARQARSRRSAPWPAEGRRDEPLDLCGDGLALRRRRPSQSLGASAYPAQHRRSQRSRLPPDVIRDPRRVACRLPTRASLRRGSADCRACTACGVRWARSRPAASRWDPASSIRAARISTLSGVSGFRRRSTKQSLEGRRRSVASSTGAHRVCPARARRRANHGYWRTTEVSCRTRAFAIEADDRLAGLPGYCPRLNFASGGVCDPVRFLLRFRLATTLNRIQSCDHPESYECERPRLRHVATGRPNRRRVVIGDGDPA